MSAIDRPGGTIGAHLALADLRYALSTIKISGPQYAPGHEPSLEDTTRQLLDFIEHALKQIEVVLGPGLS
jgi:hypothetical protein